MNIVNCAIVLATLLNFSTCDCHHTGSCPGTLIHLHVIAARRSFRKCGCVCGRLSCNYSSILLCIHYEAHIRSHMGLSLARQYYCHTIGYEEIHKWMVELSVKHTHKDYTCVAKTVVLNECICARGECWLLVLYNRMDATTYYYCTQMHAYITLNRLYAFLLGAQKRISMVHHINAYKYKTKMNVVDS